MTAILSRDLPRARTGEKPDRCIAVINAGSSSIKFALYRGEACETLLFRGQVEQIGVAPHLKVVNGESAVVADEHWEPRGFDHRAATGEIIKVATALMKGTPVAAVGHRVVHGGTQYSAPVRIERNVVAELAKLTPLAPLHQPHNLAPIEAILDGAPHLPQVACFDTAFHRAQPALAQLYALPRKFGAEGIRRYGFHGLSYEYITASLHAISPELADRRLVIAHLGNGASLCAVHKGKSIASTMGFTAVDGLMMGTRSGSLDPGLLVYLMDTYGMDARRLETLIYRESGLLGVSGISSDMRKLHAAKEPAAAEAIALFVYRIVREIGSMAAALGGLDGLIFTGGIGENDAAVRARVAEGCRWLGVEMDETRNTRGQGLVNADHSRVAVWVIATDEERMVGRHTSDLLWRHALASSGTGS